MNSSTPQETPGSCSGCRVCSQIRVRKPQYKQLTPSKTCVLCRHPYCNKHATNLDLGINLCEINHRTYYNNHRPGRGDPKIWPSVEQWRKDGGDGEERDEEAKQDGTSLVGEEESRGEGWLKAGGQWKS